MSRRYAEQVEVRVGEPMTPMTGVPGGPGAVEHGQVPTAFLWRGRLHVVRTVLGCWTQRLPWWRLADWQEEDTPADAPVPPLTEREEVAGRGGAGSGGTPATVTAPAPVGTVDELEQQVWRVEASAGRALGTGVYDLARSGTRWQLLRVSD